MRKSTSVKRATVGRKAVATAVAAMGIAGATVLVTTGSAQGHGYADSPTSRQVHCAQGDVADCGAVENEPQSVEGPKGFPGAGPEDGTICAGGNEGFAALDDPRDGEWPTTKLEPGADHTFSWTNTARHSTTDYQYFVTKDGWDPAKKLTRADLEPEPFLTVPMDGEQPAEKETHDGKLPDKSGHHLIVGVWNVADTSNAFYSCADVEF
ncbi:lytic polysaccharide monooxygenase auxiliary activity family 9 protein [Streptomyces sp. Z26]|uniref:lytic polysaccharide monooxygenase auxiliary activity family 9 protein n=1 Tax=Streptomyces sp. Z26 TaxID=2500177 RepID=UPI000EF131D3|nr:lytic polysaccharide monooxygenase auxiliary activity family 9 protein [Streptomyces sp. Z26]RLL67060.1 chitin-binding protein [Streptomyces sp. Z26]